VPAISVGSVEVDVLPNAQGIRQRMQRALVPAADEVGNEVGRVIGRHISTQVAQAIRDGVTAGGRTAQAPAARQGQSTGSTFARSLRTTLEAALRNLPEIRLHANSTDAEREIYQIRAQLRSLQDSRIGIDISSADAVAAINHLQERLQRLSASDADVAIRVDAASAATQLAAIQAQVNRLDGDTARVDVDTSSAVSGMQVLTTAAIAFGPAIIPVLPVVAAGLGAIAAAGVAAGVGIGSVALVAVPAFKQIGSVLQAQKAAQTAATSATNGGAAAASQAASRSLQQASAAQALATAERNGARQIAQAQQQVVQAKRAAADAVIQAAQRNQQAARQVQDAERALKDAQVAATRAQQDLTAARKEAALELEDLNNRLADSVLSQRDAEISLTEATAQRDAVLKSATATELDKKKAILQYDQAVQRLKEQTTETGRLKAETAAANKAGVEGSNTVKNAQDKVAQAQRAVADQARAVKDAQAEAARVQVQTARQVADAQQRVSEATANVAVAQQNAADAVASAQRQVQSASMSAAGGVDQAAVAQAKYQAELAKLTPSARATLNAFLDLRTAFGAWSKSLQPQVMPIFTRALNGIRKALPALTPFVKSAADAISGLQDRASRGFKSPWWRTFRKDLQGSVKPAITGLGVAFGNVFKGMVGVIDAFLPHMGDISDSMQGITKRFANWGTSLKGSPAFEKFLSFASEKGPLLGSVLAQVATAFLNIGEALSPISGPLLQVLGGVAEAIGIIAAHAPWLIQGIYAAIVAWKIWTIAIWAWDAAMAANPITLIIIAIVALIAIGVWAFNKFPWFRNLVLTAWNGIKVASLWLWNVILKPFFQWFGIIIKWLWDKILKPYIGFLIAYWKTVAKVAMWLWHNVLSPVFHGIAAVIVWWWKNVVQRYFNFVRAALRTLGDAFKWVYSKLIKPAWQAVATVISSVWRNGIKPAFNAVKSAVRLVGDAFGSAVKAIKTAWDKIRDITKKPVQFVVGTVYNNGIRKVWNLVTDAFGGKHLDKMKFAAGGIMPGYTPGKDVHLMPSVRGPVGLSGGEAIMRPEWTRAVGAGYVTAMNAAARRGGVPAVQAALGYKDGGIFGGIGDVAGGVWDKLKKGTSWLTDSFGSAIEAGVKHVVNPLIDKIPGGNIGFTKLLKDLMKSAAGRLVKGGKEGEKRLVPIVHYSATKGVEQWRPVVLRALAEVHQSKGLANTTLRRMQQESGGNPTIVNKWDSNWLAGHPSVGLMQVIRGTFQHYAGKYRKRGPFSYGVSVDPLANVYSSMRYALGAYGSLSKAYNRAGGYDSGGYLQPGMNLAYNGTGRPEPVFTQAQASALTSMASRGGTGVSKFEGDLYLDSGEFLGRVRGEAQQIVSQNNGQLLTALGARPRG